MPKSINVAIMDKARSLVKRDLDDGKGGPLKTMMALAAGKLAAQPFSEGAVEELNGVSSRTRRASRSRSAE